MTASTIWILLIVVAALTVATLAFTALRAWRLFRTVNRVQAELMPMVDGLAQRAEGASERAEAIAGASVDLQDRVAMLQGSITRLSVLLGALREASDRWSRLTRFVR